MPATREADGALPNSRETGVSRRVREELREEHQAISAELDAIEALLTRLGAFESDAEQGVRHLERLARKLPEHFAREEAADGVFAKALDAAPRSERKVVALRRRHAPLGSEIQQILEDAGYAGIAPDAWRRVAKRFGAFARALRNHERAEDRLIADAYLQDLGSGD